MSKLVCLIRGRPVHDAPEERIRQSLLAYLIGTFGCPRSLIAVEVSLRKIFPCPHQSLPNRRLDIVCFSQQLGTLLPLLIIECKASAPKEEAYHQLNGYNFFAKAPIIALAWPGHIIACHRGKTLFQAKTIVSDETLSNSTPIHREHPQWQLEPSEDRACLLTYQKAQEIVLQ